MMRSCAPSLIADPGVIVALGDRSACGQAWGQVFSRSEGCLNHPAFDSLDTTPDARDPILELDFPRPLRLKSDPLIWLKLGLPVAGPVFLLGLLLGAPVVASRLTRLVAPAGAWLSARPRRAIGLVAVAAVAVQCHPVLFQGRSFASPNNGGLMLYGSLPTLPGNNEYMFTNTMASDTGALLFNHIYYPMIQRDALLKHGEWPLWNRYSLCGEPLLGQGQSMFGDPFNFLTILAR